MVTRQINIGGKNKYLINGVMVQNNKVADFFQSVGLNINNPHFLIMQGRVTKGPGFSFVSRTGIVRKWRLPKLAVGEIGHVSVDIHTETKMAFYGFPF